MMFDAVLGSGRARTHAIRAGLAVLALGAGYALWWIAPPAQSLLGLGWAGDFGQLCLVILAVSVIGRVAERFLP